MQKELQLARNLVYLREKKRLALSAAAELMAINKATLHNYENGREPGKLDVVVRLAEFYGHSIDELLFCKIWALEFLTVKDEELNKLSRDELVLKVKILSEEIRSLQKQHRHIRRVINDNDLNYTLENITVSGD